MTWVPAVVTVTSRPLAPSITPAMTERAALPVQTNRTWGVVTPARPRIDGESAVGPGRDRDTGRACGAPSGDVDARDGPGDDEPLDLRGAFEDRVDLGVPVPALDRVLADIAVSTHDLNGLLGDPH